MDLLGYVVRFAIAFPAIILHEMAHGYAAYLLGDTTAKDAGRLTINPLAHVDLWGTVLLPALLLFSGSRVVFGYAKPVPINPWRFRDQRAGMLITGIAGPAANLVLATVAGVASRAFPYAGGGTLGVFNSAYDVVIYFAYVNLVLLFFNLIPIPPLDGSRVVQRFLPDSMRNAYHSVERYGFMILFALLWFVPQVIGVYFTFTVYPLFRLLTGVWLA